MRWFDKIVGIIENIFCWIGRLCIILLMILISADTIFRYFFDNPLPSIYEITQEYLMPGIVFLSISYVYLQGGHVKVEIFTHSLKDIPKKTIHIINDLGSIILFGILFFAGWRSASTAMQMGVLSNSQLGYPLAPALFLVPIGAMIMIVRLFQSLIRHITSNKTY